MNRTLLSFLGMMKVVGNNDVEVSKKSSKKVMWSDVVRKNTDAVHSMKEEYEERLQVL